MKKILILFLTVTSVVGLAWAVNFYWHNFRGASPAFLSPSGDIRDFVPATGDNITTRPSENKTDFPLTLPDGFLISIFADDVPGARVMAFSGADLFVSQTKEGTISRLPIRDGRVSATELFLKNLRNPHGLAFDPHDYNMLYYATESGVYRVSVSDVASSEKIIDLPAGGRHTTRTLLFGPDDRLYVTIGSSCDVCEEAHPWLAGMISLKRDGSDVRIEAIGLRNAVFMDIEPITGNIWLTEMGRDRLGDDVPPDELNRLVIDGNTKDYGWPICYGQNIHDTDFDKNTYIRNPCEEKIPAAVDLQAHSAPLGIAFVPEEGWPEDYWYDALVAYHGSWNRTVPTGYKIVRHKFDADGNYLGVEDFISGWLTKDGALGRPVDVVAQPGGVLYVSDDKAGVIYQIRYLGTI